MNDSLDLYRYPVTYTKLRDRCKLHHNQNNDGCGEALFRTLPLYVTENLVCKCDKDYREHRISISNLSDTLFGTACSLCGRPHRYSIRSLYWTCEGCDQYFTLDFRKPNLEAPPRYMLCERCDTDVPVPVSRRRITRISFD